MNLNEAQKVSSLSPREADIMKWVAQGHCINIIAPCFGITTKTCYGYVERARTKLGAVNVVKAVEVFRAGGGGGEVPAYEGQIRHVKLSARQQQVLQLVIEGYSCKEIGDKLGLSVRTVETHMCRVRGRLGVRNRVQAILEWRRQALVPN